MEEVTEDSVSPCVESQSPLSLSLDPPDLRNWYASYNTEALENDSSDVIADCEENESLIVTESENLSGTSNPEGLVRKRNASNFDEKFKDLIFQNDITKFSQNSELFLGDPQINEEEADLRNWFSSYKYSSPEIEVNNDTSPETIDSILKDQGERKDTDGNGCLEKSSEMKNREEPTAIDDKENQCNIGKGFVFTKKDVKPKAIKHLIERTLKGYAKMKGPNMVDDGRRVLSERIEFDHVDAASVSVVGKWNCPKENKREAGPPLKQLRLENWVRKAPPFEYPF